MAIDLLNAIPNRRAKKQSAKDKRLAQDNRDNAERSLKASKIELRLAQAAFFANLITKLAVMFTGVTLFSTEALVQNQVSPAAFNHPPLFLLSNWVERKNNPLLANMTNERLHDDQDQPFNSSPLTRQVYSKPIVQTALPNDLFIAEWHVNTDQHD
jgi:hypothetical protein